MKGDWVSSELAATFFSWNCRRTEDGRRLAERV